MQDFNVVYFMQYNNKTKCFSGSSHVSLVFFALLSVVWARLNCECVKQRPGEKWKSDYTNARQKDNIIFFVFLSNLVSFWLV